MLLGIPAGLECRLDCGPEPIRHARIVQAEARGRGRHPGRSRKVACCANSSEGGQCTLTGRDLKHLEVAVKCARGSEGETQPHPNAGCVLVSPDDRIVSETYQRAQGTTSAEVQAVHIAGEQARGCTAYLNLESGDCHGEDAAVRALLQGGVKRVVLGLRHPLSHMRGQTIRALMSNGISVACLEDFHSHVTDEEVQKVLYNCMEVNEPLLHRAVTKRPFAILKYAMTLDGKIAASTGHSSWVSTSVARKEVFRMRASSDAVIVGGQTVRRDNPRLTTRRETGHAPVRVLMSRTLDLPEDANLWDVGVAPTIVMTQMGARRSFQSLLRDKGVEVIEFDFLTPGSVADYCYERGFLQCLWECGGELAAPAISQNAIHKVVAFVAPKIIGGTDAPTPCGDLGFVEMTQAVPVAETTFKQVGPDLMVEGYLPASGGLQSLHKTLLELDGVHPVHVPRDVSGVIHPVVTHASQKKRKPNVGFYKTWEEWGSLSNFSPHPIWMFDEPGPTGKIATAGDSGAREWPSVEHYYQAQKFSGTLSPESEAVFERIASAATPEEAARIGRSTMRSKPHLVCPRWQDRKLDVMMEALRAKFTNHDGPRQMLMDTKDFEDVVLMELSPHDYFWGCGADMSGENHLGKLLERLRFEIGPAQSALQADMITI